MPFRPLPPLIQALIAFSTDPAAATPVWDDVTPYLKAFQTSRGRDSELGPVEGGTGGLVLDNPDRRFEPSYAGDTYNYVTNPSFESALAPWAAAGETGTTLTLTGYDQETANRAEQGLGYSVARVAGGAYTAMNYVGLATPHNTTGLAAPPAGSLSCGAWVSKTNAAANASLIYFRAGFFSAGLTQSSYQYALLSGVGAQTGAWLTVARAFVVPAWAQYMGLLIYATGTLGQSANFDVDGVTLVSGDLAPAKYHDGSHSGYRWEGAAHASRSAKGGTFSPNVVPMRRARIRAIWPRNLAEPVDNSSFERGSLVGWDSALANATLGATLYGFTTQTLRLNYVLDANITAGGGIGYATVTSHNTIPVEPGQVYTLSAWFLRYSGSGNAGAYLRLDFIGKNGGVVHYAHPKIAVTGINLGGAGNINPIGTSWTRWGGGIVAPADAVSARIQIYPAYFPAAAMRVMVDNVQLSPGLDGSGGDGLIQPVAYDLFSGYVERWPLTWQNRSGEIRVSLVDEFEPLKQNNVTAPATTYVQEPSGARIDRALTSAGFPSGSSFRAIAPGQSTIQASDLVEAPALDHALAVADSELGVFFFDGSGKARFLDRATRAGGATRAAWSNDAPPAATNLLSNGGFESGTAGWTLVSRPNTTTSVSTEQSKTGAQSLKILETSVGADYAAYFFFTGIVGLPYTISAYVKITTFAAAPRTDIAGNQGGLTAWDTAPNYAGVRSARLPGVTTGLSPDGWVRLGVTIVPTVPLCAVVLYPPQGTMYVDNVQIEQSARATPYISTNGVTASRAAEYRFKSVLPVFDQDKIRNEIRVTRAGMTGTPDGLASNPASQTRYRTRTLSRSPLLAFAGEAQAQADYLLNLYKDPLLRFDSIAIDPLSDETGATWPILLGTEIGDRNDVIERVIPGGGSALTRNVYVERIQHDVVVQERGGSTSWRSSIGLSPADKDVYWKLGTSALGIDTKLGY